ncbi:MAG: hypothetical protein JSS79_05165 [Bacteroidetes bacterium]|nr:hypothetical protein [Bacteroidota bacterium]
MKLFYSNYIDGRLHFFLPNTTGVKSVARQANVKLSNLRKQKRFAEKVVIYINERDRFFNTAIEPLDYCINSCNDLNHLKRRDRPEPLERFDLVEFTPAQMPTVEQIEKSIKFVL